MSAPLPPDRLELLLPALRDVAEMVGEAGTLDRDSLRLLLLAAGLDEDWALDELERWVKVLAAVHQEDDPVKRELAKRGLTLRGIPEAAAVLAVSLASRPGAPETESRPVGLWVSADRLDLGTLSPGQPATAEFVVGGGPGQILVESDQVRVTPQHFGPGTTRIRVEVRPMQSGVLWTSLRLVTPWHTVGLPVLAEWCPAPPTPETPAGKPATSEWLKGRDPTTVAEPSTVLRGRFVLPDLRRGMEGRLGLGYLIGLVLLDAEHVLMITAAGAALLDLGSGECLWEIDVPSTSGALSPDGTVLALGGTFGIYLWDVRTGQLLRTLEGPRAPVRSVAFSPDRTLLASASLDGTVRLWRVANGALLHILKGHSASVRSVAFSPDGMLLASGSQDGTVRLWRVPGGTLLQTLKGHTASVWSVAFSPDGALLASASFDGTVRLWACAAYM